MSEEVFPLFAKNSDGRYVSSIATLFLNQRLILNMPRSHALQRWEEFPVRYRKRLQDAGEPAPEQSAVDAECRQAVDLILAPGDVVLIRPDVERMSLALAADTMLQSVFKVPKHRVRFLLVNVPRVRQVLRERGELWRISRPPTDPAEVQRVIQNCRVAIREAVLYYHSPLTGTRWLTVAGFDSLAALDDAGLARQLGEITEFCLRTNGQGNPEVDFHAADARRFGSPLFVGLEPAKLSADELRTRYEELRQRFRAATPRGCWEDKPEDPGWCAGMFKALLGADRDDETSSVLLDPGAEEWLKVRWLPGGRFSRHEFIFESLFEKPEREPSDPQLRPLWDSLARGFIANFIRDYGDVEYLNLGRVASQRPPAPPADNARRDVYLAEVKRRGEHDPRLLVLRVQRWGIRERLLEQTERGELKDLSRAVFETEEYGNYTLDRRLGCLQLGMRLPPQMDMRRTSERYAGPLAQYVDEYFPAIYYERRYLPGIPSNRIPVAKMNDPAYAMALARLLGQAAALNLIVGRTEPPHPEDAPGVVLFDDGDEVVVEGSDGLPREIVLSDHGGTFADFRTPSLLTFAAAYAGPVNRRKTHVPYFRPFAEGYLGALQEAFLALQLEYRELPEAFDNLFKHLRRTSGGFADRWAHVLQRMNSTDVPTLVAMIRTYIDWSAEPPSSP